MPDQLRLDIQIGGGADALRQLDQLDAKMKGVGGSAKGLKAPLDESAASTRALEHALVSMSSSAGMASGPLTSLGHGLISVQTGAQAASLGLAALGVAVVGGLTAAVGASMQFQTEMGALRAILPKREVDEFGGALGDLALQLGQKTVFSSTEAIEAFGNLARSGVSAKDIVGGVGEAALNMAAAMGGTPKEAALTLGAAMREFNIPASQATHVADQFAASVHIAGLSADEMRNGVSRVGPVANALGASLDDVITGMELLARSGLSASRAGTALAQIYEDVVNPRSKEAAALMQQLGFTTDGGAKSFITATGTVKPFIEVVKILGEGMKDLTPAQEAAATQTEFTRRAMQAALVVVNAYKNGAIDPFITSQHEARDAASAMQERLDNLPGSVKQLSSSVSTLAVLLGDDLSPALRKVTDHAKIAADQLTVAHGTVKAWEGTPAVIEATTNAFVLMVAPVVKVAEALNLAGTALDNLQRKAITTSAPGGAPTLANGLNEQRRGEQAASTFQPVGVDLQGFRSVGEEAGGAAAEAFAQKLVDMDAALLNAPKRAAFVDWGARTASEVGAALQANKGNIEAAIADVLGKENGPAGDFAVKQILERAEALKTVQAVLGTLTPAERAHYEALLLAAGADNKVNQAEAVLTEMRQRGLNVTAQGVVAIRDHEEALAREKEAAFGGAVAVRAHQEALEREKEASLGGAVAIRDHQEQLARQKEAALGGAAAIRAHEEALAREKEASLGGAVAIRDHQEGLAREKEAALGGAVAIRSHEEALAREHEAALGGARAIRDHTEALEREHVAALGGYRAIRDHEEALAGEKTAALGGERGLRDHAEALEAQKVAALGGHAAIRAHSEALEAQKVAALGGQGAIAEHTAALARQNLAAENAAGVSFRERDALVELQTQIQRQTEYRHEQRRAIEEVIQSQTTLNGLELQGVRGTPNAPGGSSAVQAGAGAGGFGTSAEIQAFLAATGRGQVQPGQGGASEFSGPEGMARLFEEAGRYAQANAAATAADTAATKEHTQATAADKFNIDHLGALTGIALNALTIASGKSSQAFLDQNKAVDAAAGKAFAMSQGMDFAGAAAARMAASTLAAGGSMEAAAAAAQEASEQFKLAAANAQALMNNQIRNAGVLGGVTQTGLTYGQIYGGSGTQGGGQTVQPGNYYGIPVVNALTPGTLRGFATGGWVDQPSILVNRATGRPWGQVAENGPERIGGGAGATVNVTINASGVDALRDNAFWRRAATEQIVPALRAAQAI